MSQFSEITIKLSIITVNLNDKVGLSKTIKSVIEQEFRNFEFIVIDGGSTDGSKELLQYYENHIDYFVSESDEGIYHGMNKGINQAHGEYCLFLNSGDLIYSSKTLQEVFDLGFSEDIVTGAMKTYSNFNNSQKIYPVIQNQDITLNDLLSQSIWHQATFIKKTLFDKYGTFDESNKIVSDIVFFINTLILQNASFRSIDITICFFNEDGISKSFFNSKDFRELDDAIRKLIPERILSDYRDKSINKLQLINQYRLLRTTHKIILYIAKILHKILN